MAVGQTKGGFVEYRHLSRAVSMRLCGPGGRKGSKMIGESSDADNQFLEKIEVSELGWTFDLEGFPSLA
jgi:hypothetical protein